MKLHVVPPYSILISEATYIVIIRGGRRHIPLCSTCSNYKKNKSEMQYGQYPEIRTVKKSLLLNNKVRLNPILPQTKSDLSCFPNGLHLTLEHGAELRTTIFTLENIGYILYNKPDRMDSKGHLLCHHSKLIFTKRKTGKNPLKIFFFLSLPKCERKCYERSICFKRTEIPFASHTPNRSATVYWSFVQKSDQIFLVCYTSLSLTAVLFLRTALSRKHRKRRPLR